MRLALQARVYAFPTPFIRYPHGPDGINSPSVDVGYDPEGRLRSGYPDIGSPSLESPGLAGLCRRAEERFVSMYPWMVGNQEWMGFDVSCRYYHSESVSRFLADQVDSGVSDRCKALIDSGWVVKDDALYHPGMDPGEMTRALEAAGGAPASQDPKQLAETLTSLYGMAMENDEIRSHLPKDIQLAMGKEPFTYEHYDCGINFCYDIIGFASGWDHESYLRSQNLDLTDVCMDKYNALIADHAWVDHGTYWGNFLYFCSIWESSDAVDEVYRTELSTSISERCLSLIDQGWRLSADGFFYPDEPADNLNVPRDLFEDMCLSRSTPNEFNLLWDFHTFQAPHT